MEISVKINQAGWKELEGELRDQAPYALQLCVNALAVDAQKAVREHGRSVFHLRKPDFYDKTVNISFANKTNVQAVLKMEAPGGTGREDEFTQHEDGGDKTSVTGGKIAVPSEDYFPNLDSSLITSAKRPRNLKRSFKIITKGGKELIFVTKGSGKRRTYLLAYTLIDKAHLKARLGFYETAIPVIEKMVDQRWQESVTKAITSAK